VQDQKRLKIYILIFNILISFKYLFDNISSLAHIYKHFNSFNYF